MTEATLMVISTDPITEEVQVICAGEELTLSASGGMDYKWQLDGQVIGRTASLTVEPTVDTQYELTMVSENGCTGRVSYPVTVLPTIEITYEHRDPSCENITGSIQLSDNGLNGADIEFSLSNDTYSESDNSTTRPVSYTHLTLPTILRV